MGNTGMYHASGPPRSEYIECECKSLDCLNAAEIAAKNRSLTPKIGFIDLSSISIVRPRISKMSLCHRTFCVWNVLTIWGLFHIMLDSKYIALKPEAEEKTDETVAVTGNENFILSFEYEWFNCLGSLSYGTKLYSSSSRAGNHEIL
jgi:hypothetical protein